MATITMFPMPQNFNLQEVVEKVTQMYQAKGFAVTAMPMGAGASIDFKKNDGGIQKFVGLTLGVKANILIQGENIVVNYTDAEWTSKIIGFVVGWFLCWIPWITAIVGCVQQVELPKSIGNDIQMLASSGGAQYPSTQQVYVQSNQPVSTPQTACIQCGVTLAGNEQFCASCGAKIG